MVRAFFRYLSLLTALTRLGSLLLCPGDDYDGFLRDYRCLQYVHYGCRGAHYGHGGCSDEACDDPVDVPVSLLLSVLVARTGLVSSPPLNSAFSAPKKRLNNPLVVQEMLVLPLQL